MLQKNIISVSNRQNYYDLSLRVRIEIEKKSCIRINIGELNRVSGINVSTLYILG